MKKSFVVDLLIFVYETAFCQATYFKNVQDTAYGEFYGLVLISPTQTRAPYYTFTKDNNFLTIEYINPLDAEDESSYWGTKKVVIRQNNNLRIHDYFDTKDQYALNDYGVSREEYKLLPDGRSEYLYNYNNNHILCEDNNYH